MRPITTKGIRRELGLPPKPKRANRPKRAPDDDNARSGAPIEERQRLEGMGYQLGLLFKKGTPST